MSQFSTHTYQYGRSHHLGTPLAVYGAALMSSNLLYTLIGAVLFGELVG